MLKRSTWVILIIALVLVAVLVFWQRTPGSREGQAEATPTTGAQLEFDFTSAEVSEAVIQNAQGDTLILKRGSDGMWQLIQPEAEMTDSQVFEDALSQFLSPHTVSTISSSTALKDLGLEPAEYKIMLRLVDDREVVINVGKSTPTGSGYYVLNSGPNRSINIIGKFNIDTILDMIQEPPVLPTPTATIEGEPQPTVEP